MRANVDPQALEAMRRDHVTGFALLELDFPSGTVYLADLPHDVEVGGVTYVAAQGIGTIEPIQETDKEVRGLMFTLSGVTEAAIAGALTELAQVQGSRVTMKWVVLDGGSLYLDSNVWTGYFDIPELQDGVPTAVIKVTTESDMIRWKTPKGTLASHADQLLRSSSDLFFQYEAEMSQKTLVWPGLEFFKQ